MMARGGMNGGRKDPRPDTVKRVVRSFYPYKLELIWITISVLASAALGALPALFLRTIINQGIEGHKLNIVVAYSVYSLVATIGATGFTLIFGYLSIVVGQHILRDLRDQLYDHLQGMSLRFFSSTRTGEIQSRLANDVGGVQSVLSDTVSSVLSNVTIVISTIVIMVYLDWRLTLMSLGVLPIFALIGARVGEIARGVRSTVQTSLAEMSATMQETLSVSGVLLSKTSGRRELAQRKISTTNESLTAAQIKQSLVMKAFFNLIGLAFSITPVLVYLLAGYLIAGHNGKFLTIGTIVAFTSLQSRIFFPLTSLLNVQVDVSSSLALFDRIFEYLDLKQEIVDSPNAIALSPKEIRGDVKFSHVYFKYDKPDVDTPAEDANEDFWNLKDVTFEAKSGQLIALVGHSGAGKTTMTYLIPRLYDPNMGSISIDGIDVREIRLDSLGQAIGVVTQETYLVHDTIRENLRYGKPDANDDELIAAAKTAAIHAHIESLPDGYDTVVGERGYKLSGGEKQRIAIARAVLKNPRILILDEATSSLDTQSERLIQSALVPLMAGRTTFAIAHRLSTILAADLILVIANGEIVERGTHTDLLAADGAYAALYAAQFENGASQEYDAAIS